MKTLIRNASTACYFHGVDIWGEERQLAFDFKLIERAIRFVRDAHLKLDDLELVIAFDDPRFDINMPIDARFGSLMTKERHRETATVAMQ
jgi:hypothetical protein